MSKKIYTKDIVLEAAKSIAKEVGLEKLSIRSIARKLNTSVSPVYDSFESMETLIEELVILFLEETNAQTTYFKRNEDILLYGIKHPKLYRDIQKYTREHKMKSTMYGEHLKSMKRELKLKNLSDEYLNSLNFDILIYISGLVNLSTSNHIWNFEPEYYIEALNAASELFIMGYTKYLKESSNLWIT